MMEVDEESKMTDAKKLSKLNFGVSDDDGIQNYIGYIQRQNQL